jgi:large subunit ribosomal protein L29
MSTATELRELPDEELINQLEGNKEELFALRFQLATGQLDDTNRIRTVRHDIARILTVLRQRHIESEVEAEVEAADRESVERGREALASGKVKGDKLSDMVGTSMPKAEEEPAEAAVEHLEEKPE